MARSPFKYQKGQSLIELLIGITVAALIVGSAGILISTTLKISRENRFVQAASFLNQDLMEKVAVYAEGKWFCPGGSGAGCGIYNLNKTSANTYFIRTTTQPFSSMNGSETITLDGIAYTRYFYIDDVLRGSCGIEFITSGNGSLTCLPGDSVPAIDPSTERISVVTSWPTGGRVTMVRYLTRRTNNVIQQTNWKGGPTNPSDQVVTASSSPVSFFSASPSIDYTSIPGSIKLQ